MSTTCQTRLAAEELERHKKPHSARPPPIAAGAGAAVFHLPVGMIIFRRSYSITNTY